MTWMELLHLLEQQPYKELNKEMRLYSFEDGVCTDYAMVEFVVPTEFCDVAGNMCWQEWLDGGMMMQIRIKPTSSINHPQ